MYITKMWLEKNNAPAELKEAYEETHWAKLGPNRFFKHLIRSGKSNLCSWLLDHINPSKKVLNVKGDLLQHSSFADMRNIRVSGDVHIDGSLWCNSLYATGNITITGTAHTSKGITSDKSIAVYKNLYTGGDVQATDDVFVSRSAKVGGSLSTEQGYIDIGQSANIGDIIYSGGGIHVNGGVTNGDLIFTNGFFTVNGDVKTISINAQEEIVIGGCLDSMDIMARSDLRVNGSVTSEGSIVVLGALNVVGCVRCNKGHIRVAGKLSVLGSVLAARSLQVGGRLTSTGIIQVGAEYGIYAGISMEVSNKVPMCIVGKKPENLVYGLWAPYLEED